MGVQPFSLPALAEELLGATAGAPKAVILARLWAAILQCTDKQKQDVLKLVPATRLLAAVEGRRGDAQAAYAAVGCLAALAQHPKCLAELTATPTATNRLVAACGALLAGDHDRSRLPAAQLLLALSHQPLHVPRLAVALPTLLSLLAAAGGPAWAGGRTLAAAAAGVLAALLAPSEWEPTAQQQARCEACLAQGAVRSLLALLQDGGGPALLPAAACLRFLALSPGAADVMAGDARVARQLLALLGAAGPGSHTGVAAYVTGTLWELAAAAAPAQQLLDAGAVPALLEVVARSAAAMGASGAAGRKAGKGKGSSKKAASATTPAAKSAAAATAGKGADVKRGGSAGARGQAAAGAAGAAAQQPPPPGFALLQDAHRAAEVALCNATGALHHLSFLDGGKAALGASGRLPLLVGLLRATRGATYDNVLGTLWQTSTLDANQPLLAAAGAPAHLVAPIPQRWTTHACADAAAAGVGQQKLLATTTTPAAAVGPVSSGVRETVLSFAG